MDEDIRFIRLIVPANAASEVLYVQSNKEAQIGEYIALPKGYRLRIIDNSHDGSLVVRPAPRWGAFGQLLHAFRAVIGRKGPELPAGALLMVEENHKDPALKEYYEYLKRKRDRAERGVAAEE